MKNKTDENKQKKRNIEKRYKNHKLIKWKETGRKQAKKRDTLKKSIRITNWKNRKNNGRKQTTK